MRKEEEYYQDRLERGRETKKEGWRKEVGMGKRMKGSKEREEIAH